MAKTSRTKRSMRESIRMEAALEALSAGSEERAKGILRNPIDKLIFEGMFDLNLKERRAGPFKPKKKRKFPRGGRN